MRDPGLFLKEFGIAAAIGATLLIGISWWFLGRKTKRTFPLPSKWRPVGTVSSLRVYPVKSCKGVEAQKLLVGPAALSKDLNVDRQFMIVDEAGQLVSARTHPKSVLINAEIIEEGLLRLTAPDMPPLELNFPSNASNTPECRGIEMDCVIHGRPVKAMDMGNAVSQWLTEFLVFRTDRPAELRLEVRLVFHHLPAGQRRNLARALLHLPFASEDDKSMFHDEIGAAHIISDASLEDLNDHLKGTGTSVSALNFRPNITISGGLPYAEDDWLFVKIGEAVLRTVRPCTRCIMTTVDPQKGEKNENKEPLASLRKYRTVEDETMNKFFNYAPKLVFLGCPEPSSVND
ncbi:unnamed protein product [Notodromas monacha]|uniref:MOSC domain-containing protein n=1 Tax=Notodromas monacha TaxID=399045 RepID=A0A7R9GGS4_9CRUS|nr:unnamed protein product [Notodromas monacha]CAG0922158.1 unnamed protein product [Notodromas monacha]